MSDGWERGDCSLLREQMQRLSRLAHASSGSTRIRARPDTPGAERNRRGAAYVDDFIAGHSMAAFEQALEVVADA